MEADRYVHIDMYVYIQAHTHAHVHTQCLYILLSSWFCFPGKPNQRSSFLHSVEKHPGTALKDGFLPFNPEKAID